MRRLRSLNSIAIRHQPPYQFEWDSGVNGLIPKMGGGAEVEARFRSSLAQKENSTSPYHPGRLSFSPRQGRLKWNDTSAFTVISTLKELRNVVALARSMPFAAEQFGALGEQFTIRIAYYVQFTDTYRYL